MMNKKEILRYLKYGKALPTEADMALIDLCIAECEREITPKSIYRIVDCHTANGVAQVGPLTLHSAALAKNLAGCRQAVVMAATLGPRADLMIRRAAVSQMAKSAVLQSVFAQQIEEYIDAVEAAICTAQQVKRLRPRFSPGYADLPLETQRQLFTFLEVSKRLGVTLTDNCLMTPTKSVTAFIGIPSRAKEDANHAIET